MLTTAPDCAEKSQLTLKLKTAQKLTTTADYDDDGQNLRHSCPTTTPQTNTELLRLHFWFPVAQTTLKTKMNNMSSAVNLT
jgi:hypothetical protein